MKWNCKCPRSCPVPEKGPDFYAQFGVASSPPSGSNLPFYEVFKSGDGIYLEDEETIILTQGYLYLIEYLFIATPEPGNYMEIVPGINGTLRLNYAFFAPAGSAKNVSASGGFTTNEAAKSDARLTMNLTYPAEVRNIDISGSVSVTPLMKLYF